MLISAQPKLRYLLVFRLNLVFVKTYSLLLITTKSGKELVNSADFPIFSLS